MIEELAKILESSTKNFDICGFITRDGNVYPLGTDTKVLSTVFELIIRPTVVEVAEKHGYEVEEPEAQNHYPDFTLKPKNGDKKYIALDVKTTYRRGKRAKFGYTLGGYTSFIKKETPTKNIVHHFDHYESHYIVGFVYTRVAEKKAAEAKTFKVSSLNQIVSPYDDVELFVQEKWRVAGDSAGSGNTTNIGSVSATLEEFREGKGIFQSEDEFLEYWRGYGRTNAERKYKNITDFRKLKGQGGL